MKCPQCDSTAVSDMVNREEIPDQLELNKCHECSCIFLVIIFQNGVKK